jgi:hypothetical protein
MLDLLARKRWPRTILDLGPAPASLPAAKLQPKFTPGYRQCLRGSRRQRETQPSQLRASSPGKGVAHPVLQAGDLTIWFWRIFSRVRCAISTGNRKVAAPRAKIILSGLIGRDVQASSPPIGSKDAGGGSTRRLGDLVLRRGGRRKT